jgi:hypothetical protein
VVQIDLFWIREAMALNASKRCMQSLFIACNLDSNFIVEGHTKWQHGINQ